MKYLLDKGAAPAGDVNDIVRANEDLAHLKQEREDRDERDDRDDKDEKEKEKEGKEVKEVKEEKKEGKDVPAAQTSTSSSIPPP